jgi:hypothetical protein
MRFAKLDEARGAVASRASPFYDALAVQVQQVERQSGCGLHSSTRDGAVDTGRRLKTPASKPTRSFVSYPLGLQERNQ